MTLRTDLLWHVSTRVHFNYVHAYAYTVYTKYTAYAYISALKQLGRPIATGWSALQDGAVSGIQDFERL